MLAVMNASNETEYNEDTVATTVPGARLVRQNLFQKREIDDKVLNRKREMTKDSNIYTIKYIQMPAKYRWI